VAERPPKEEPQSHEVEGQVEEAPAAAEAPQETPDEQPAAAEAPQETPDEQPAAAEAPQETPDEQPADAEPAAEAATGEEAEADVEAAVEDAEPPAPEEEPTPTPADLGADARYSATGKRKSSVARVILRPGKGAFELNGRTLDAYFPRKTLQEVVRQPLAVTGYLDRVDIRARIHGGGISSQADAVRHGIAKALIDADPHLRGELKRRQLLTRDPRVKERRKAGLKKARKRPQFSKR
jgi:small subunit ribosomal protein S9